LPSRRINDPSALDERPCKWEDAFLVLAFNSVRKGTMPKFSPKLMEHFLAPRNQGRLESADRTGISGVPHQGPFLRLELRLHEGVIAEARFQAHGCGPAIACGSVLTELITGRRIEEALGLDPRSIIEALDGLPDDKLHCAEAAIAALRDALKDSVPV
jgi:nitrogen fixation NifU-like protein